MVFAITLWWIWRWRNNVAFGRSEDIPVDVSSFLHSKFEEHYRALHAVSSSSVPTRSHLQEINVR